MLVKNAYGLISIIIIFFAGTMGAAAGLPEQYRFALIDVNDGLSHGQVNCLLKDSRGYLWVGTTAGLNRYDGNQVKIFQYDSRDSLSLSSNNINTLFEDPDGNIWVGIPGGFNVYNPQTESFDPHYQNYLQAYSLPGSDIENIVKDREGNYWFVHTQNGITRYNPQDKSSINLQHIPQDKSSISSNQISAIGQNSQGDFWLILRSGVLERLDGQRLEVVERNHALNKRFNGNLKNYSLIVDQDDDLWIHLSNERQGVFFFNQADQSISHFHKDSPELPLNNNLVRAMVEDADGMIWVGTDHGGINIIDKEDFSVRYVLHNPEVKNSLVHNTIYTLYKDDQDIIWIGTYKNGLNFYHKNIFRFSHYKHQASVEESLPFDDINRFVEDEKGNIWIGTNGGGLIYFDRSKGTYRRYMHDPDNPNSLSSDIIVSLLYDQNQVLWIGTYFGGLVRFDGQHFKQYKHDPHDPGSLSDDSIWELFEDSKGNIWIGTLSNGLDLYNAQEDNFTHYKAGSAINSYYVTAIAEDAKGNIWLGGNYGIEVINREKGKIKFFLSDPSVPNSLLNNAILSIFKDKKGRMWVGSQGGLDLFDEESEGFSHFTTKDGLPHNTVLTLLEGNEQDFWLSTPNGISHFTFKDTLNQAVRASFQNYSERDGLQGKVFNENAALKTKKGELIFGGPNGYNIFQPANIGINAVKPKVVFTDFQLFNRSLQIQEKVNGRVMLPKALSETEQITLKHDENVFSVEFAALNFFHPQENKYRYKLEGFDKEWLSARHNTRRVSYTNLDPGEYYFKVEAANNDGVWSDEAAGMKIKVLAPFWRTPWAYAVYVVLILLALYVARNLVLLKARMRFKIEQERTEARQMHELDLLKIRFFTNVSHEFRTPLSLIVAPVEKLLKTAENPEQLKQFDMINRNAKRLLNLVNQLLDFRKLEVDGIKFYPSEGNIIKFIEESVNSFSDLSEKKEVALSFHANVETLQASFDMDKLEKILFNLLSNAFKFTPERGEIEVRVNCSDSESEDLKVVEIKVKDSGIGIPIEKQEQVFERFFRNDVPSSMLNQGSGIGLSITKEFVKIHGGSIHVDSEPGKGSCFTVSLLVKKITSAIAARPLEEAKKEETAIVPESRLAITRPKVEKKPGEKRPTVLLVEDNEDFRFYLKDNLGIHFTIIEAKNGKEGWQKALSPIPDLIVSDLMMPEMNGIDLCKKVKEDSRTSHIPFVLLTAHSAEEQKLKGLNIGANDYITKPFNFEILLSRIKNLIQQGELMQKVYERKISVQTSELDILSLDDKLIQNAIRIVEEHLSDPDFSVEFLSRELGMSRAHLYKKMVSLTGKSPVEFIRKIRLQQAAQFLEKSQLSVSEVAYKVGFNNTKYFTKYFKNEFNILPSLYAGRQKA